jgi:SAM-dependent methyltransferase
MKDHRDSWTRFSESSASHREDFCYLRDQFPLSAEALAHARVLCDRVGTLVEERADFLTRSGRDPGLHLPRGHWDPVNGSLYIGYRTLMQRTPDVLNHLRIFSQVFTGYQLLTLSGGYGLPITTSVPEDADERLATRAAAGDPCIEEYRDATRRLPELLHLSPPARFGEVGWRFGGNLVNPDVVSYLERVALLADCGVLWDLRGRARHSPRARRPHILEIGSGYGGLAHYLKELIPEARYFCVDLPESLLFSSGYLSTQHEQDDNALVTPDSLEQLATDAPGFTFVPNYLFDDCLAAGLQFDLILNTLSMSEMDEKQIHYYCEGITRLLGPEGVFFEQNHDEAVLGLPDARRVIAEYLPCCLPLPSLAPWRGRQGRAHLWAARRVAPHAWRPGREVVSPGGIVRRLMRRLRARLLRPFGRA